MSDEQDRAEALDDDKFDIGEGGRGDEREVIQPYVDPSQDVIDDEPQAVAEISAPRPGDEVPGNRVPAAAEEAALHIEPDA